MDARELLRQRRETHALVRRASDRVRGDVIPRLAAETTPLLKSYLHINQQHFADDVFLSQMVHAESAHRFIKSEQRDPYYETTLEELGSLRNLRGNVGGFEMLHPVFLEKVACKLFDVLEAHKICTSDTSFIRLVAIVDFALQFLHVVKDGSGRTGEDILVQLGLRHHRSLTFSLTGYRASLDSSDRLMFHRHVTQRVGHIEFIKTFMSALGVPTLATYPTHILEVINTLIETYGSRTQNTLTWPDGLTEHVNESSAEILRNLVSDDPLLRQGHPYFDYASFVLKELCYLTLCLEDPDTFFDGLLNRYPLSMGCRVLDFQAALKLSYRPIAEDLGALTDEAMAHLDLMRLGLLESSEKDLEKLMLLIKDGFLVTLLNVERQNPSLEGLLKQLSVPNGWSMSPQDFRTAINAKMNWTI